MAQSFGPKSVTEDLAHNVVFSVNVAGAAPQTIPTTTYTSGGITYTITGQKVFSLTDASSLSSTDTGTYTNSADTSTWNGYIGTKITTDPQVVALTPMGATGGTVKVSLVETDYTHATRSDGVPTLATADWKVVAQATYNILRANVEAVSVDSRKAYGQPDLAGELPADPNAEQANVNFNGWIYKGGLFAGNAPSSSGDLSGTARVQIYLSSPPTLVNPQMEDLVLLYLGCGSTFGTDSTFQIGPPAATDPNIGTPMSQTTWANAWSLAGVTNPFSLTLGSSTSSGQYVNAQVLGYQTKLVLYLQNESSMTGTAIWPYFATAAYGTASGLYSASDAQPHLWIVDKTS